MSMNGELPSEWIQARIQDVAQPGGSWNPKQSAGEFFHYVDVDALDNSAQVITSPKRLLTTQAPSRARLAIKAGDVIFSLVRPYLKNIAIVPDALDGQVASTAYCVMRPTQSVSSKYLFYAIVRDSFISSVVTYGNSPPAGHDDEFLAMEIPLPPLAEQRRIVAAIEQQFTRLDAGVAALKRAQTALKQYRAAVLKAAVEGNLTEEWRAAHPDAEPADKLLARILAERRARWEADLRAKGKDPAKAKYEEPNTPDTASLPELPEGWCWATLDQSGFLNRGRFSVRPRNDPRYYGGSYPFIQIGDLPVDGGPIRSFKQTLNEDGIKVSRTFAPGTVVISIAAAIGRVGLLTFESCFPDSLVGLTCTPALIAQYAEMYVRTQTDYLKRQSYASGGQPNISLPVLESLPIALPPLAEQEQIVAEVERRLSVVSELESTVEANLKRAERLRQSILERAFSGRLVPQDPTDEPASALMERITNRKGGGNET